MLIIVKMFKPSPTMKFMRKDSFWNLTIALPIKGPKIDHGKVTKSNTACALPLCLLGTSSPIAASLPERVSMRGLLRRHSRKLLTARPYPLENHSCDDHWHILSAKGDRSSD
jgi:hypothetical protein